VIKNLNRIVWIAIFVAWIFDFLFWERTPGISFALFVIISVGAGIYLSRLEDKLPARNSWWLLVPIILFAGGTFFRKEPFTTLTNYLLVLVLMGVFVHTFRGGRWLNYSISDYIAAFFFLAVSALAKPFQIFTQQKQAAENEGDQDTPTPSRWARFLPVIRGLIIAVPVVAIFAALLSAADPIFGDYLEDFIAIFKLENLPEYIFRGVYILILGYLLTGIYIHALTRSEDQKLIGEEKPWIPTFLGFTEAAIVMGSVDVLFSSFVGIQFRYFFGGQSNIKVNGYTYAEYARRGFGELVLVAVFSLLLFLGLSTISRRETIRQRRAFSGLGIGLVVLVAVILVSAFQRLLLYEDAYGFTRLRIYSHIFIVWLGILLIGVVVLEFLRKQRAFALAALIASVGFVITLNLLNVDGLIVNKNVQRVLYDGNPAAGGELEEKSERELDAYYLQSLSTDATPALIESLSSRRLATADQNELAAILACQIAVMSDERDQLSWVSYHWADARAWKLLKDHRDDLAAARTYKNENGAWWVMVNGNQRPCLYDPYGFD
jgi:hypothetical protein